MLGSGLVPTEAATGATAKSGSGSTNCGTSTVGIWGDATGVGAGTGFECRL